MQRTYILEDTNPSARVHEAQLNGKSAAKAATLEEAIAVNAADRQKRLAEATDYETRDAILAEGLAEMSAVKAKTSGSPFWR
jgi:hypothetical protein